MAKKKRKDDLKAYAQKRDFGRTPEPAGKRVERAASTGGQDARLQFVLHRHDASHLHWDLRLEAEGVLRSFAVPKGLAWNPEVKRLAVRTEDHPIEYTTFAGEIPAGEYGAGTMRIEDRGLYAARPGYDLVEGLARGELKLEFYGRRMRGEWHLVRTSGRAPSARGPDDKEHWLLFKTRDLYAGSNPFSRGCDFSAAIESALPKQLRLAETQDEPQPFTDEDWLFEAEFPGVRVALEKDGERLRFRGSREARALDARLATDLAGLARQAGAFGGRRVILDGVLVATRDGVPVADDGDAFVYCAHDCLYYEDWDLRKLPLRERKRVVDALVAESSGFQSVEPIVGEGEALARVLAAQGYPAMIAKRADSIYAAGRAANWRQIPVVAQSVRSASATRAKHSCELRITNRDKVWFPHDGITKGDVLDWYELVGPHLLPFLKGRPLHLQRFPDGIEAEGFYQKNLPAHAPQWLDTVSIESVGSGREIRYLVADSAAALKWCVQEGGFEFHPWLSRVGSLDEADFSLIDLDPKAAPFSDVVAIARFLGDLLHDIGLRPSLKTSGQSGLHILVPLATGYGYDLARGFAEGIAKIVVHRMPRIATIERDPRRRAGKVYVDFLQNRRAQTVVPPFCVRPRAGAPVSTPLTWDELTAELDPRLFTIRTLPHELAHRVALARPILEDRQELAPALEAMTARLARGS